LADFLPRIEVCDLNAYPTIAANRHHVSAALFAAAGLVVRVLIFVYRPSNPPHQERDVILFLFKLG
jgi:hypothetical protein